MRLKRYDPSRYWAMRAHVIDPDSPLPRIVRLFYLYRIKRSDAFNLASMGTDLGVGAAFATPPHLVHGLNGIVVTPRARIGVHCTINQQVTIGDGFDGGAPTIGDHCFIGAGAKIIGGVTIGDHVRIGANAVVVHDIPSWSTAVGVPAVARPRRERADSGSSSIDTVGGEA
ncbi:hypothetical protein Microterr_01900 [Microbacterium terricola]|uniref:Serine acetyltransferase n=1 Tax=Microbacterium terricola TaxID=344163 RepID=A0ABM8DVJ0_9MICO|nr:hypothetical protein Microterr_01900 [Microbacterium terricola]